MALDPFSLQRKEFIEPVTLECDESIGLECRIGEGGRETEEMAEQVGRMIETAVSGTNSDIEVEPRYRLTVIIKDIDREAPEPVDGRSIALLCQLYFHAF